MATLQDIADIVKVSKATVSLALSNHPRISDATKAKVVQAARQLGYIGGLSPAEEPPTGRRRSLGVLYIGDGSGGAGQGFFRETITGMLREASRAECTVVMIEVDTSGEELTEDKICEKVERSEVDGIVVICFKHELAGFGQLLDRKFPMVFVGNRRLIGRSEKPHTVASDNYEGAKRLVDYLLELGHRELLVGYSPTTSIDRLNGCSSALRNVGLPDRPDRFIVVESDEASLRQLHEMLQQGVTAVVACTSLVGLIVLQHLRRHGIRVPEDISLVVFDDSPSFVVESPPVTVMAQDLEAMGAYAVKMLLDLTEQPAKVPKHISLAVKLQERQSCAAPAPRSRQQAAKEGS